MPVQQQTLSSADGTTISYARLGDGPPVLVLDGAFQHRAFDPRTARLTERLAADFTVLHPDRRGRGGSGDAGGFDPQRARTSWPRWSPRTGVATPSSGS